MQVKNALKKNTSKKNPFRLGLKIDAILPFILLTIV